MRSGNTISSLTVSVFTASFTSTGISFDMDVDKNKRAASSGFYGYLSDGTKKKVKVFVSMFLISACQLSAKALALLHCRHPAELGASYWVFTLLSTLVVCFYFASRYLAYMDSEEGEAQGLTMVLDATQVYGMVVGLLAVQITTLVFFLKNTNPEYISMFYSTKSGNENIMGNFSKGN
ncbi:hypothetical protein TrLO_g9329 [Triparma laevis f. longispina]|uniref:Uncharacterized protein n=1 Tax=Triparma laevis f. longispina TaxID=1714387 RepID=A0A9W7DSF1_9STRA|nr:hypothetical protein TrLO_g9329 [Triparma laevis f. longispina]